MTTYIAMLRGINVGSHYKVKMNRLRASFEALGFEQVKTYIQSGNVIFHSARGSPSDLAKKIEGQILGDFAFSLPVVLRTSAELSKAIQDNPFLQEKGIDPSKLHVTFLSQTPAKGALEKLDTLSAGPDRLCHSGKEIYLYCPNGYGRTKLSNNVLEKLLSVRATTRNWKTVNRLYEISRE